MRYHGTHTALPPARSLARSVFSGLCVACCTCSCHALQYVVQSDTAKFIVNGVVSTLSPLLLACSGPTVLCMLWLTRLPPLPPPVSVRFGLWFHDSGVPHRLQAPSVSSFVRPAPPRPPRALRPVSALFWASGDGFSLFYSHARRAMVAEVPTMGYFSYGACSRLRLVLWLRPRPP